MASADQAGEGLQPILFPVGSSQANGQNHSEDIRARHELSIFLSCQRLVQLPTEMTE